MNTTFSQIEKLDTAAKNDFSFLFFCVSPFVVQERQTCQTGHLYISSTAAYCYIVNSHCLPYWVLSTRALSRSALPNKCPDWRVSFYKCLYCNHCPLFWYIPFTICSCFHPIHRFTNKNSWIMRVPTCWSTWYIQTNLDLPPAKMHFPSAV